MTCLAHPIRSFGRLVLALAMSFTLLTTVRLTAHAAPPAAADDAPRHRQIQAPAAFDVIPLRPTRRVSASCSQSVPSWEHRSSRVAMLLGFLIIALFAHHSLQVGRDDRPK